MIVDASVWVAYFYGRDHHSSATVPWLEALLLAGERLSAPSLMLAEVGGALARRTSPDLGRLAVERLRATSQLTLVPMTDDLMVLATELAIALPARGADSVYIATARLLGQPLVTWDREQHDLGGSVVATLFPGEHHS
jgi:predicted nucleic acid-binding protein